VVLSNLSEGAQQPFHRLDALLEAGTGT
jgi:hypothetical protein